MFRKRRKASDFDAEIEAHLQLETDRLQEQGMSEAEARMAARRAFGNRTLARERFYESRRWRWWDVVSQDIRFGLRMMARNPVSSVVAILTLALGIGANTAMFTVVDHVLLQPLTYRDSNRLVAIQEIVPSFASIAPQMPVNALHFRDWQRHVPAFDQIALLGGETVNLTGSGEPERIHGARVSWNLFAMIGVQPQLGQLFLKEEGRPGHNQVAILTYGLWKQRFAGDPQIVGRKILLDNAPYTVVGVLPASFWCPKLGDLYSMKTPIARPEIWTPLVARDLSPVANFNYACIARLRPGVSLGQARTELNIEQKRIAKQAPVNIQFGAAVILLKTQITGRSRPALEVLLAAVGAVLLIVCVNIANLLLVRAISRRREFAIRAAIGAKSRDLMRQMFVESGTLSLAGGALGLGLAWAGVRLIVAHAPANVPRMSEVHIDGGVLLFTVAISILAAFISGVFPAWVFGKADPQEAMKAGARGTTPGSHAGRLRSVLIAVEVGVCAVCLIAGGLLLRSFANLLRTDKGFQPAHVVTANLFPPNQVMFAKRLIAGVKRIPGVQSVGISSALPLTGEWGSGRIFLPQVKVPLAKRPVAAVRAVNPTYFRTMGVPLLGGRIFTQADGKHRVALVSAQTAKSLWPHENPIGRVFRTGDDKGPLVQVIGVVGDVRAESLGKKPFPTIYLPYWQSSQTAGSLVVKTKIEPSRIGAEIRKVIHHLDPEMPIPQFRTMNELVSDSLAQRKFQLQLILLFATAAILLAGLGIYGVISYSVSQRRSEVGIRMALGADAAKIRGLILRQGLSPVLIGLVAGIVASLGAGRLLASMVFGVSTGDPLTVAGVIVLIVGVAASAAYLPARRATRIDPATALRYE
jgi:putative ABC transport system permease protein